jgi:hypothetical protein
MKREGSRSQGGLQPPEVDMSEEAIDRRLRELGQLYRLGMELRGARWLGTVEELARDAAAHPEDER